MIPQFKGNTSFIIASVRSDSMSTNSGKDMWTKIINPYRLRSQNCLNATNLNMYTSINLVFFSYKPIFF